MDEGDRPWQTSRLSPWAQRERERNRERGKEGVKEGGKGEGEGDGDGEGDEEGAVYSGDQAAEEEDTDGMGVAARGLVRHVNERLRGRRVRRAGQGGEERVWDEPRRV